MATEPKRPDNVYTHGYLNSTTAGPLDYIEIGGNDYGLSWDESDQAIYDLYLKSLEYQSELDLMEYNNQYNSMASQVQRAHAAGKNPDFMNFSNEPSKGNAPAAPTAPVAKPMSDKIGSYGNLAQQFLQLLPQAISLYTQVKGSLQGLEMNQLKINDQMDKYAYEDALSLFTPDDFDEKGNLKDESLLKISDNIDRRLLSLGYNMNSRRNSRSAKRRVSQYNFALDNLVRNNQSKLRSGVYARHSDMSSARFGYLGLLGQYGFDLSDDDFVSILKDFNKIVFEANKHEQKNRKTSNESNVGLNLIRSGQEKLNKNEKVAGAIEYLLGLLIQSNISFSRSSGPKGVTNTFGF